VPGDACRSANAVSPADRGTAHRLSTLVPGAEPCDRRPPPGSSRLRRTVRDGARDPGRNGRQGAGAARRSRPPADHRGPALGRPGHPGRRRVPGGACRRGRHPAGTLDPAPCSGVRRSGRRSPGAHQARPRCGEGPGAGVRPGQRPLGGRGEPHPRGGRPAAARRGPARSRPRRPRVTAVRRPRRAAARSARKRHARGGGDRSAAGRPRRPQHPGRDLRAAGGRARRRPPDPRRAGPARAGRRRPELPARPDPRCGPGCDAPAPGTVPRRSRARCARARRFRVRGQGRALGGGRRAGSGDARPAGRRCQGCCPWGPGDRRAAAATGTAAGTGRDSLAVRLHPRPGTHPVRQRAGPGLDGTGAHLRRRDGLEPRPRRPTARPGAGWPGRRRQREGPGSDRIRTPGARRPARPSACRGSPGGRSWSARPWRRQRCAHGHGISTSPRGS
jgi:hypothetical protein